VSLNLQEQIELAFREGIQYAKEVAYYNGNYEEFEFPSEKEISEACTEYLNKRVK
jgi:hypothetical protein